MTLTEWLLLTMLLHGMCGFIQGLTFKEFCDGPTPYLPIVENNKFTARSGMKDAECLVKYNINMDVHKKYEKQLLRVCEEAAPHYAEKVVATNRQLHCTYVEGAWCGKVGGEDLTPIFSHCVYYKSIDLRNNSEKVPRCRKGFTSAMDYNMIAAAVQTFDINENVLAFHVNKKLDGSLQYSTNEHDGCGRGWEKHIENGYVQCVRAFFSPAIISFWNARKECQKNYGELAFAKSTEKLTLLQKLAKNKMEANNWETGAVWMGGLNGNRFTNPLVMKWEWLDHTNMTITSWAPNNPSTIDVNHRDNCVALGFDSGLHYGWVNLACDDVYKQRKNTPYGYVCQRPATVMLINQVMHLSADESRGIKFGDIVDRAKHHQELALICVQHGAFKVDQFERRNQYCTSLKALGFKVGLTKESCFMKSNWLSHSKMVTPEIHTQCRIFDKFVGYVASTTWHSAKAIDELAKHWKKDHSKDAKQLFMTSGYVAKIPTMTCTKKGTVPEKSYADIFRLSMWNHNADAEYPDASIPFGTWDKSSDGSYPLNRCVDGFDYRDGVIYNADSKKMRDVPTYFQAPVICNIGPRLTVGNGWCASSTEMQSVREDGSIACLEIVIDSVANTWYEAKKKCEDRGSTLASFLSPQDFVDTSTFDMWTKGAYDSVWAGAIRKKGEKEFHWLKNQEVMYFHRIVVPVDETAKVDECLVVSTELTHQWYAVPCDSRNRPGRGWSRDNEEVDNPRIDDFMCEKAGVRPESDEVKVEDDYYEYDY